MVVSFRFFVLPLSLLDTRQMLLTSALSKIEETILYSVVKELFCSSRCSRGGSDNMPQLRHVVNTFFLDFKKEIRNS